MTRNAKNKSEKNRGKIGKNENKPAQKLVPAAHKSRFGEGGLEHKETYRPTLQSGNTSYLLGKNLNGDDAKQWQLHLFCTNLDAFCPCFCANYVQSIYFKYQSWLFFFLYSKKWPHLCLLRMFFQLGHLGTSFWCQLCAAQCSVHRNMLLFHKIWSYPCVAEDNYILEHLVA